MDNNILTMIIRKHSLFLEEKEEGEKADLRGANLFKANLSGANLSEADLRRADLSGADLRRADLSGADLRRADLRRADLREADLRRADLRRADLRMNPLKIYKAGLWEAIIQPGFISIGCQTHSVKEWEEFTDKRISDMHEFALEYWRENKMIVISIANSLKG